MSDRADEQDEDDPENAGDALNPALPLSNARHERAVHLLLAGNTKTAAADAVGLVPHHNNAWRMFNIPAVKARIEWLKMEEATRAAEERAQMRMHPGFSKRTAMVELEGARALAMNEKRPSAAVAAIVAKCKLEGLIREVLPLAPPELSKMTLEQLEQFLADLAGQQPDGRPAERIAAPVADRPDNGETTH